MMVGSQLQCESSQCNVKVQLIVVCESSRPKQTNKCQEVLLRVSSLCKGREAKRNHRRRKQKNNTRDSNVVPHRSTNLARHCLTSLSRREAVLSMWYGRSQLKSQRLQLYTHSLYQKMPKKKHANPAQASKQALPSRFPNEIPNEIPNKGHPRAGSSPLASQLVG